MAMHPDHQTPHLLGNFFETTGDKVGGAVSAAMISSPFWIQQVKPISEAAALLAPILGCIYLSLQIGFKLWDRARNDE